MPHIHEKIDFIVNAFIVYQDKLLLIDHKKLRTWLPVGGHIELDEDPEEALRREVKEECGLEVKIIGTKPKLKGTERFIYKPLFVPSYMDIHNCDEKHRHIGLHYFAIAKTDKVKLAESEHNEIRWFSKKDIGDPKWQIIPAVQFYSREALKAASRASTSR